MEDQNILEHSTARRFVVSNIDNWTQIHINTLEFKDLAIKELVIRINHKTQNYVKQQTVDVIKITKNLTTDQIDQLSIKVLNSEVNISQFKLNYDRNSSDLKKAEEDVNYDSEEGFFRLKNRK